MLSGFNGDEVGYSYFGREGITWGYSGGFQVLLVKVGNQGFTHERSSRHGLSGCFAAAGLKELQGKEKIERRVVYSHRGSWLTVVVRSLL